jgi:hypothetical protein
MAVSATSNSHASSHSSSSHSSSSHGAPSSRNHSSASHASHATGLDRYRSSPAPTQRSLTPVQHGEAARAADAAAKAAKTPAAKSPATAAATPRHPIHAGSTVVTRRDGTRVTTVHIDVRANFRVDGGTLPKGQTAKAEARAIERAIERDFSKTYRNPDGSITRYVTNVNMTVGQPAKAGREQLVYVSATDTRLNGGLGIAPGFEKGTTAFISDAAGARTAPHEFGHLAGLRHTAQVSLGCVTATGISVNNLMSQTGCSPTSQQIERSQLQQIFKTPDFR